MTTKPGAYLGGIRSVADLRERSFVDADTQCWHWRLAVNQGSPRVHLRMADGTYRVMRGRQAAAVLAQGGEPLPKGSVAFAKPCCTSLDCVNPEHATYGSRKQHGKALSKSGRVKNLPTKIAAATKTGRSSKRVKLSMEMARSIRASEESTYVLARRLGVTQSAVHSARVGKSWRETSPAASVFSWGGQ